MSARIEAQKNDFLKEAKHKFPEWNHNAQCHLEKLNTMAKAGKALKGIDGYLIMYLQELEKESEKESEAGAAADKRKDKSPKKRQADPPKSASKDKQAPPKSAKDADPLLETVDSGLADRAAADDAPPPPENENSDLRITGRLKNAGISDGDMLMEAGGDADESALNVEAVENAGKRAQKEAAVKRAQVATARAGISDGDVLMKPLNDADEEALNVEAVQNANRRELRKRADQAKEIAKAKDSRKRGDETESDGDVPLLKVKSKKPQKKARKSSETPVAIVDSDSEDDKKKGRFKPKELSRILAEYDIGSLRGIAQQMVLARDGIDVNVGATARLLNMQTLLVAAELTMDKQEFKNFKAAMLTSYDDKNDQ